MFNYFADLIFEINLVLLYLFVVISVLAVAEVITSNRVYRQRKKSLIETKKKVYALALSGEKLDTKTCALPISKITPQQFLDVITNRNRGAVFFNEAEQRIFRSCFLSSKIIASVYKTAATSWDKWSRIEAILTLGYAQDASSVAILKKTINDKDEDISYFSIIALGQIRDVSSVEALLEFVRTNPVYRSKIFSLLETFPSEMIAKEVIALVDSPDPLVRSWAVKLIQRIKATQYFEKIVELTNDTAEQVRASACDCLGELRLKETKENLVRCLDDDNWLVRASAIRALVKVLGKDSIPEIIHKINDASLLVIESVKSAMIEQIDSSIPYIEKFLFDKDEMSRKVSIEALESSGYVSKIFEDILKGHEKEKVIAEHLLKGLVVNKAYAGIEGVLVDFKDIEQKSILAVIRVMDSDAAEAIEQDLGKK